MHKVTDAQGHHSLHFYSLIILNISVRVQKETLVP
jgi:hypothetical protein